MSECIVGAKGKSMASKRLTDHRAVRLWYVVRKFGLGCCGLIWLFCCCAATPRTALGADVAWDIAPYDVRVWLALEPLPELVDGWRQGIETEMQRVAELACGASWQLSVDETPVSVRRPLLVDFDSVDVDTMLSAAPELAAADKLYLVAVTSVGAVYEIRVREFDIRTEYLGPVLTRRVLQSHQLGTLAAYAVLESFSPIGEIDRVTDDEVLVRMRAGLLAVSADSPLSLPEGGILRPVLRKYDRLGKPIDDGIDPVPWTLLRVTQRRPDSLACEIVSGLRTPLRTRSSRSVKRLVLAVKPTYPQTVVRLHANGDPDQALAGYELYWRLPGEKTSNFVGRSDWQGRIAVARDEHPIKILYVKNGGRLLARLPLVPGYEPLLEAAVTDDQARLEAEGFLRGMQEEVVDLVARRTVLAVRIRRRLEEQLFDEAEALIDQMQALPTRDDLERRLRDRRQTLSTKDRAIQSRIDRMFRQTEDILQKYVNNRELDALREELSAARRGESSVTETASAGGDDTPVETAASADEDDAS